MLVNKCKVPYDGILNTNVTHVRQIASHGMELVILLHKMFGNAVAIDNTAICG